MCLDFFPTPLFVVCAREDNLIYVNLHYSQKRVRGQDRDGDSLAHGGLSRRGNDAEM